MASFHPENGNLILNVVYDGAPRSGKTESMRALGRLLGREVHTPKEENGRTLYFDWLEYEGGMRHGGPICCRVAGVPGQAALRRRRVAILGGADVVIFVVDSTPEGFPASLKMFKDLFGILEVREREIPVLVQLNKRDLDGALDAATIRGVLGAEATRRGHKETVAVDGQGIRELFVLAVGEALRCLESGDNLYRSGNEFRTQEVGLPNREQLLDILSGYDEKDLGDDEGPKTAEISFA